MVGNEVAGGKQGCSKDDAFFRECSGKLVSLSDMICLPV